MTGRDFVVGDLHGCRKALDFLLEAVGFDGAHDRLISVGDLTDRGPHPMECLALLEEPWFHAVRGNHDEMILQAGATYQPDRLLPLCSDEPLPGHEPRRALRGAGGNWFLDVIDWGDGRVPWLFDRIEDLGRLPHYLTVGAEQLDPAWRYNVVHAELTAPHRADGVWSDAALDEGRFDGFEAQVAFRALWSRDLAQSPRTLPCWAPGLSRTWCGHSIQQHPTQRASHCCIDTGAFVGYRDRFQKLLDRPALTLVQPQGRTATTWSVPIHERNFSGWICGRITADGEYLE